MTTRRTFITGLGCLSLGLGSTLALTACSTPTNPTSPYTGEARTLALAAALENQLTAVYAAMTDAIRANKLGPIPPAFAEFIHTASAQHAEHADAWNGFLRSAGHPAVTASPLSGHASVLDQVGRATTIVPLAELARQLENQAAQTHLAALGDLSNPDELAIAASTAPVEAMHATIVSFILGDFSIPNSTLTVAQAAHPSDLLA